MGTILIVSYEQDAHARHLLVKAKERGLDAVLWDISIYPRGSQITSLVNDRLEDFRLHLGGRVYQAGDLAGVWWRRPGGAKLSKGNLSRLDQYVRVESDFMVWSLMDLIPNVNWISRPENTRLACRKPIQLGVARRAGFCVPDSCITNSPEELEGFLVRLQGRSLIMKPVGSAFMPLSESRDDGAKDNRVVFTRIVEPGIILRNLAMASNCPVIFQEAVDKDCDVRVTVVDDFVCAAEIMLEGCSDESNLDWRNHGGSRVYSQHVLPPDVRKLCIQIVADLGLRFGCVDLGFSRKNGYTFFEVNPQGQWLPSEQKLGYNVSGALLDSLIR